MKPFRHGLLVALLVPSTVAAVWSPQQLRSEPAVADSLRISYYYSFIHDVPLETWLRYGETLTIHDGGGCDIARCEADVETRQMVIVR